MSLTFGSLFAGIGGIDLGLERAGMECKWQVEIDDYARAILKKHWPEVPKYRDVRYFLGSKRWRQSREAWAVDLIAGGFPCQDISKAGRRAGIEGKRSGLWSEFGRIIRLLRPRYVLVENVPAVLGRGFGRVLGDLAALRYDAEWTVLSACAFGAPHSRERLFLLADSYGERRTSEATPCKLFPPQTPRQANYCGNGASSTIWRVPHSEVFRVADGISDGLDRSIRGLGNAVVPQISEYIGRLILATQQRA